MLTLLRNPYNPLYALALLSAVLAASWAMSKGIRFYRDALTEEGDERVTPLDGLRGILCFGVMAHHASITLGFLETGSWKLPPSRIFTLLGQTSVTLFFCITAFLFWGRVVAKQGHLNVYSFLRGRCFRLAPLYWFSCIAALMIAAPRIDWFSFAAVRGIAQMALLGLRPWGSIGAVDVAVINAKVTWTLTFEWCFYLLLPALALVARYDKPARLWLVFIAAILLFGDSPVLFFFPGILAVYVARRTDIATALKSWQVSVLLVGVLAAFPLVAGHGHDWKALVLTTALFVPIACGNRMFGILTLRGLRLMGLVSFSVYLLHGIVLFVARPTLASIRLHDGDAVWRYWACVILLAIGTLILSALTYRWIELPFIRLERRIRTSTPTAELIRETVPVAASVDVETVGLPRDTRMRELGHSVDLPVPQSPNISPV